MKFETLCIFHSFLPLPLLQIPTSQTSSGDRDDYDDEEEVMEEEVVLDEEESGAGTSTCGPTRSGKAAIGGAKRPRQEVGKVKSRKEQRKTTGIADILSKFLVSSEKEKKQNKKEVKM